MAEYCPALVRFAGQWLDRRACYFVTMATGEVRAIFSDKGWDQGDAAAPAGWTCGFNRTRVRLRAALVDVVAREIGDTEAQDVLVGLPG